MKVIVAHDEKDSDYLAQYASEIEFLGPRYKIVDIEEKYIQWLTGLAQYVESNFIIELCQNEECISENIFNNQDMILASIGKKHSNLRVDAYYNMQLHHLEETHRIREYTGTIWINCYSDAHKIDAVSYIQCIRYLRELSNQYNKPIIIYATIYVPNETYRYRTLTYKIINHYLTELNGVLINKCVKSDICKYYTPLQNPYEFYLNHMIYLDCTLNEALTRAIPFLDASKDCLRFKNIYRNNHRNSSLFYDVFYESIDPELEIYVPLNLGNFREPEDYKALGLQHIPLIGDYGLLYGRKREFDVLGDILKSEVTFPYYSPIISYLPFRLEGIDQNFSYHVVTEDLKHKGKGVYIGVVTVDNVDYTNQALRNEDGKSRIACIWHQRKADEGTYYEQEQIDEAIQNEMPGNIIELPEENSVSTIMLGIAGGKSKEPDYSGVATEAEFIVAKINAAPETLQRLYGGMPSEMAVTMGDTLIGVLKLINFAKEKGRPLVLCIPFNTNIDPHDGSVRLYQILGLIAQREYLTIIIPSGEEADKMHHFGTQGSQPTSAEVQMRVQKENQNIVGIIYQKFVNIFTVILYPPPGVMGEPIDLKTVGITRLRGATIYSNGSKISFLNGSARILFRIENPQVGNWRIEMTSITEGLSQIDIWISQQELNAHITLNPSSPFITVGSLGNTQNVMTVGGYDEENMVVLRSSGRGYSWDDRVKPLFVTNASRIISPSKPGIWVSATGTLPAASVMLGVVATLYCKFNEEQVFPFPNTLVMNSIILSWIKQLEGVEYPNPSHGYGQFDLEVLNRLLYTPYDL
jgi:hypothetical protein